MHLAYGKLMGLASPALRVVAIEARCSLSSSGKLFRFPPLTAHRVVRRGYAERKLDLLALDQKWRERWAESPKPAQPAPNGSEQSRYILPMFPYPSGSLHLGHLRVYAIADVLARYNRLRGYDVILPMGWDSFGLPAENAAMERGIDPAAWTKANIAKMKEQLRLINGSWDWSRELSTCDPEFYKHTQRIFLLLHEMGLAYQAEAEVNYDPVDKTVLANEQVDDNGCSWRSGAKVEKRRLKQWFLRISEYRDALLQDLETLAKDDAWPERVLAMQKNWLGKSMGAMVKFPIMVYDHTMPSAIEVFTTRPDTLFGAQYLALAASHPIVSDLAAKDPELQAFLDTLPGLPPGSKVGYLLPHLRAVNPLAYHEDTPDATKASIPIYVAPYVLGDYGEGAVMGVPGHDHRDHAFWKEHHYDEPIRVVLAASEDESTTAMLNEPFVEHGFMTEHSGPFKGKSSAEAGQMLVSMLEAAKLAQPMEKWRIRDWLISRQRYWGTPIPIVHCGSCGPVPVPEDQLPVLLPEVTDHFVQGMTGNRLESAHDWINTSCPKCGGAAKRDTDTMDTFVDSSWYYMRFIDPHNDKAPFSPEKAKAMLPVDLYFGGIEHAILHLLYARFIYKALMESSLVRGEEEAAAGVQEPFRRLVTQGMVHGKTFVDVLNGRFLKPDELDLSDPNVPTIKASGQPAAVTYAKMSKSKYNGVDPTGTIAKHGSDATRAHMIFQAPVSDVLNWDEEKISGVTRWLGRLYDVVLKAGDSADNELPAREQLEKRSKQVESMDGEQLVRWDADSALWRALQSTIRSVTASYDEVYSLNTIVSDLMSLTNTLIDRTEATPAIQREALSSLLRMLAPITPAFAEECWAILHPSSPALFDSASFPRPDSTLDHIQPRSQTCAVQVNGKLRCTVEIPRPPGISGDELKQWVVSEVMKTEQGRARLSGGSVDITKARKTIVVRGGQLVNFVL